MPVSMMGMPARKARSARGQRRTLSVIGMVATGAACYWRMAVHRPLIAQHAVPTLMWGNSARLGAPGVAFPSRADAVAA